METLHAMSFLPHVCPAVCGFIGRAVTMPETTPWFFKMLGYMPRDYAKFQELAAGCTEATWESGRWSRFGPVGAMRCEVVHYYGVPLGSTMFVTVAPMQALKCRLLQRCPEGLMFSLRRDEVLVACKARQPPCLVTVEVNYPALAHQRYELEFTSAMSGNVLWKGRFPPGCKWHTVHSKLWAYLRTHSEVHAALCPNHLRLILDGKFIHGSDYVLRLKDGNVGCEPWAEYEPEEGQAFELKGSWEKSWGPDGRMHEAPKPKARARGQAKKRPARACKRPAKR